MSNPVSGLGPKEETVKLGLDARGVLPGEKGNDYSRHRELQYQSTGGLHVCAEFTAYLKGDDHGGQETRIL